MKVFSSFKDVKVIKLSSVEDAFTGFANKVRPFCFPLFKVLHFELAPNIKCNYCLLIMCICIVFYILKEREDRFRNRVKRYVGIWCCMPDTPIGHIYYDMYWDEKPGWKAIPPQSPEEDHPPL